MQPELSRLRNRCFYTLANNILKASQRGGRSCKAALLLRLIDAQVQETPLWLSPGAPASAAP